MLGGVADAGTATPIPERTSGVTLFGSSTPSSASCWTSLPTPSRTSGRAPSAINPLSTFVGSNVVSTRQPAEVVKAGRMLCSSTPLAARPLNRDTDSPMLAVPFSVVRAGEQPSPLVLAQGRHVLSPQQQEESCGLLDLLGHVHRRGRRVGRHDRAVVAQQHRGVRGGHLPGEVGQPLVTWSAVVHHGQ